MKRDNGHAPDGQSSADLEQVLKELDSIKRLFVLLLMKGGASGREIAKALNVHESTVSRQFRLGEVELFATRAGDEEATS